MNKHLSRNAFTLVELLVVITIIGILAGIALPVFQKVQINAEQTKVLANAKQIGLALKLFANDFDGQFPTLIDQANDGKGALQDANDAFGNLIPAYVPNEKTFFVKKSAWCKRLGVIQAGDEDVSAGKKLEQGENHYAYVSGLNDTSTGAWPLLGDGFKGAAGVGGGAAALYTNNAGDPGGVWEGNKAIVIRVDQSGAVLTCNKTVPDATFAPRDDSRGENIFINKPVGGGAPDWLSATAIVLNPK